MRSAFLKKYYDAWGSRVYLFSSELFEHGNLEENRAGNTFEVLQLCMKVDAFKASRRYE